jgi:hypothetical protein
MRKVYDCLINHFLLFECGTLIDSIYNPRDALACYVVLMYIRMELLTTACLVDLFISAFSRRKIRGVAMGRMFPPGAEFAVLRDRRVAYATCDENQI